MATNLLEHWSLNERPFEATWDSRFYFGSRDHEEALNRLLFLVGEQSMNMGMLTGQVGCGKTLTRSVLIKRLNPKQHCVVLQENSNFGFKDLLVSVVNSLNGGTATTRQSKYFLYEKLRMLTGRLQTEHRHLVLVFDEAQEMNLATLNELKLLTNFNGDGRSSLSIILLGQPELRKKISQLPPIDQRISLRFHLGPIARDEASGYLKFRLITAGHNSGNVFDDAAIERAYEAARGIPRELNRLAKLSLELAWLQEKPFVDRQTVDVVVADLERQQTVNTL